MKKAFLISCSILVTILVGLASSTRAAQPPPEPPPPHLQPESLEEFPFLDLGAARLEPQHVVETAAAVPWSRLVFQSYRNGNWEIYTANGDGSSQVRRTNHGALDIHPRLNRGCDRIVFTSDRAGNYEIYAMNFNGSGLSRLTSSSTDDVFPSWSPDGARIAFQSYRDGQAEIYVMNANGSGQTRLTWNSEYDGTPVWSPDGTKIAFISRRTGGYRIWVMNADGSGQTRLSNQPYSEKPTWSPDGSQIAYDSDGDNDGWQEIWLMNSDGSNQHAVYDTWQSNTDTWVRSWSPDGRYVAFTRISFIYYHGNWYWTTAYLDAWDSISGGYIRLSDQGTDWRPDWQTTDVQAPTSNVHALPAYSRGTTRVHWSGSDTGAAGIKWYDVQIKDPVSGSWDDVRIATTDTFTDLVGPAGHTCYFRSRATDNAYNVENWPAGDGDTYTTFYNWAALGTVQDNRGIPVVEATVATAPSAFDVSPSDCNGRYSAYVADSASAYTVQYAKNGYRTLPPTSFPATNDVYHDVCLPPLDNVISDGGFESGTLNTGNWQSGGTFTPTVGTGYRHTGQYGAFLGLPFTLAAPLPLRDGVELPQTPLIAVDSTDTLHLIWREGSYSNQRIYYAQGTSGGVWSTPVTISGGPTNIAQVLWGVASDGRVHVVWRESNTIRYAWRDASGTWSTPAVVDGGTSEITDFAVGDDGAGHLVWASYDSADYYYNRVSSDGNWGSPIPISFLSSDWGVDDLAVGPDGRVHLLWRWSGDSIYYSHLQDDGSWLESELVYPGGYNWYQDLYIDDLGRVHVVWANVSQGKVYHRQRFISAEWSPVAVLSTGMDPDEEDFAALIGPGNILHVIWPDESYPCRQLYYTRIDSTGYTYPETVVDTDICVGKAWLQRFGDDIYLFIHSPLGTHDYLCYQHLNLDDGQAETICINDFFDEYPNTVLDLSRNLHAVWRDGNRLNYTGPATATESGDSTISQRVTVPPTATNPTLSFVYRPGGGQPDGHAQLEVRLDDGISAVPLFSTTSNASVWTHHWSDLTPWAGQTVTLTFNVNQTAGQPRTWTYLDEITLGSAYPDLWVNKTNVTALPGEQIVYNITYGNRGGATASNVRITDTLPNELLLVDANPSPVFNTLMGAWEWVVGDMTAESGPLNIVVTATIAPTATMWSNLTNTVSIGTASSELEMDNNIFQATVFIGRHIYLPIIMRQY